MAEDFTSNRSIGIIIVEVLVCALIDGLSLFGNVLVSLAVIRSPKLRTSTNMFILALAIADILMASICIPITCGILVSEAWINTSVLCDIQGFSILTLAFMSIGTLALTAINRFFRVVKPVIYRRFFTKRNSLLLIGTMWLLIVAFYATLLLSKASYIRYEPSYATCAVAHRFMQTLVEFVFVVLAFIVIVVSYTLVFNRIRRHHLSFVSSLVGQQRNSSISVEEIKISKLLFMTVLGFAICWMPSLVIITMDRISPDTTPPRRRTLLCTYLNYLSAALNPLIYGVMNRSFRAEYKRILLCRKNQIDVAQNGTKSLRTFTNTARAAVIWKRATENKTETAKVAFASNNQNDCKKTSHEEREDSLLQRLRRSSDCSGAISFSHISRTSTPTLEWRVSVEKILYCVARKKNYVHPWLPR